MSNIKSSVVLKSGIEEGYSARNTRAKADIMNYHVKVFDEDRESDLIGLYEHLFNEMDRVLRKELGVKPVDKVTIEEVEEIKDDTTSEDYNVVGPVPYESTDVSTGSDDVSSTGDDVLPADGAEQDLSIQSVSDGGSSESSDGTTESESGVSNTGRGVAPELGRPDGDQS